MSAKSRASLPRIRTTSKFVFGIAVLVAALVSHVPLVHAAVTWNVTPSSACTLADAITASNTAAVSGSCVAGDGFGTGVINLAAGTYTLSADLPSVINHHLKFVGAGVGSTIIDGQNLYKVFTDGAGDLDGVSDLTITQAGNGGSGIGTALFAESSTVTITNVVVKNSTVDGGITVFGPSATISNVAIFNNSANAYALNLGFTNGTFDVSNVTLYNNAHGMYVDPNGNGTANLTNITSSGNGVGIFYQIGGGSPTLNLKNSILADTVACNGDTVASEGHNITADNSCGFVGTSNHSNTNAALGSLTASNGTYVLPIDYNSPAYDAGDATGAPSTDQRGVTRPQCSGVDIGAYETATCTPVTPPPSGGTGGGTSGGTTSGGTKSTTTTTTTPTATDTTATPQTDAKASTSTPKPSASDKAATVAVKRTSSHAGLIWGSAIVVLLGAGAGGWFWRQKHPKWHK